MGRVGVTHECGDPGEAPPGKGAEGKGPRREAAVCEAQPVAPGTAWRGGRVRLESRRQPRGALQAMGRALDLILTMMGSRGRL